MRNGKRLGSAACICVYLLCFLWIVQRYQITYSAQEKQLYWSLVFAYTVCGFLVILAKIKHRLYLFEPFAFISIIYLAIFVYKPFQDLASGNFVDNGVFVLNGGFKATLLFTFGYVSLYLGYYGRFTLRLRKHTKYSALNDLSLELPIKASYSYDLALLGWIVSYGLCLISMMSKGISLRYIFTLSASGERVVDESNVALLFLTNFAVTMATYWLMIMTRPGKRSVKIVITVLSAVYLIMRNARWLILVFSLAPIVYWYIKRRRRPNLLFVVLGGLGLLLVFSWMQYNRTNLALGRRMAGLSDNWLTVEVLLAPFESDLNTYKVFYNMVTRFPSPYFYMLGRTFLYTLVLFIPRVLWRAKPENPVRDMIELSMNNRARKNGTAVANIGEFYANFGVAGVLACMFLFGRMMTKMKVLYEKPCEETLIAYSILYPLLFQWVARGNFSGNFYMTLFAMLPFAIERFVKKVRQRG